VFGLANRKKPQLRVISEPRMVGKSLPNRRDQAETRAHPDSLTGKLSLILDQSNGAGVTVTEKTASSVSAVTACVGLLADMIGSLPIKLYRKTPAGREEVPDHPAAFVVDSPGDMHTSFELRQLMETGKGFNGNGYARVHRAGDGTPMELEWLCPHNVEPQKVANQRMLLFQVEGVRQPLTRYDVLYVRNSLSLDGVKGCSPIHLLRNPIGTSIAQSQAAGNLVKNGTNFPGVLTSPQEMKADQIKDAREEWEKSYVNGNNKGKTPILWGDWKYQQTNGMTMTDAQFLESRRFEIQEIARAFRIPSFLIGDSTASTTWGSGIEQQNLGFLSYSLNPHLIAWEQSLNYTLLTTPERRAGLYFKFSRAALMQVALAAQAEFYSKMRSIGVMNINEIRNLMEMNDLDNDAIGEDYTLPLNNTGGAVSSATPPQPPEE
jgi:HK97 family phage portal protein